MGRSVTDILSENGIVISEAELAHYGVPGMRWGRRKGGKGSSKTAAHPDSPPRQDPKKLSDAELKSALARLKMEREFNQLTAPQVSMGRKIVGEILLDVGKQQAKTYLNSVLTAGMTGGGLKGALESAKTPISSSKSAKDKAPEPTKQRVQAQFTPVSEWRK